MADTTATLGIAFESTGADKVKRDLDDVKNKSKDTADAPAPTTYFWLRKSSRSPACANLDREMAVDGVDGVTLETR